MTSAFVPPARDVRPTANAVLPAATAPAGAVIAAIPDLGILVFDGADAAAFLHGQLSSDVSAMATGATGWSSYNSPKGRMLASLLLWRRGSDSFVAFAAADIVEALRKRLAMFVLRSRVRVTDATNDGRRFGVAGPDAAATVAAALGAAPAAGAGITTGECIVVATPDGRFVIDAPDAIADSVHSRLLAHAAGVPPEHWRWLGVQSGIPLITRATQDLFVPQNANWDLVGGVNFRKGCYPGQEIVARMQYLGRLKERMFAFHFDGPPPAVGTALFHTSFGSQACGTVVNAATAPGGGSDLLAVVQWSAAQEGALHIGAPDGPELVAAALPYAVPVPEAPNRPKL